MRHEIVIIGSGLGGLACGRLLAEEGHDVVVLEQGRQPGGCLQSYRRDGLSYDTGMHYVGGLAPGQSMHTAFRMLHLDTLPWQQLDPEGFDHFIFGQDEYRLANGYDAIGARLAEQFPQDEQALQELVEALRQTEDGLVERVTGGQAIGEQTVDQMSINAYDELTARFSDPRLIQVLGGSAMKMELRRDSFSWFSYLHALSGYVPSAWRLKCDSAQIVHSLVDGIKADGGSVVCCARVEQLVEEQGRLTKAVCADGRVFEGDVFISDIHPTLTFGMIPNSQVLRPMFKRRVQRLVNTTGMFTVSLALKPGTIPYRNYNQYVYAPGTDVWGLTEDTRHVRGVMVSYRVPDDYEGANAEVSARQLDLLTPMSWQECSRWASLPPGHRGLDYMMWKQQKAEEAVRLAETAVPGLRAAIDRCHVSTPLTWHDYTLTPDGAAFGVRKDCRNALLTTFSIVTPLPNLLLTGQNVMLHGIEGVTMTAIGTVAKVKTINQ